jgi:membrane protein
MITVKQTSDNFIHRLTTRIDAIQRRHRSVGFILAVVKKYSDDQAGQRAALLTYYGFLSLFPLLLVATSLVDFIAQHNTGLRTRLLADTTSYLPVVGHQLQQSIHSSRKTGLVFLVGLLFTFYGARGVADAARGTLDIAWGTPRTRRASFPTNLFKSVALILGAGLGLLLTTGLASYATATLGHSVLFRLVPIAINAILLYLICMYMFLIGPSRRRPRRDVRLGAITLVIGLLILQTIGGYLITHELHHTSDLYGQFALVLVILFWLYLLAQLFTYAIEINVVHTHKLWPRALDSSRPTDADLRAQKLHAM